MKWYDDKTPIKFAGVRNGPLSFANLCDCAINIHVHSNITHYKLYALMPTSLNLLSLGKYTDNNGITSLYDSDYAIFYISQK